MRSRSGPARCCSRARGGTRPVRVRGLGATALPPPLSRPSRSAPSLPRARAWRAPTTSRSEGPVMGDLARVTLLAWPYPGRYGLPISVVEELERHDALPPDDDPRTEIYLGDAGVAVLAGDERSGLILAVVDEQHA